MPSLAGSGEMWRAWKRERRDLEVCGDLQELAQPRPAGGVAAACSESESPSSGDFWQHTRALERSQ